MTRSAAIAKVRKLLSLAKSNPGPEADSAFDLAQKLIAKFGLRDTETTPQELVNLVIEDNSEPWRELLAFAIAHAHSCRVFTDGNNAISITGDRRDFEKVKALYDMLAYYAIHAVPRRPSVSGRGDATHVRILALVDEVWCQRFYHGFVKTIARRFEEAFVPPVEANASPNAPENAAMTSGATQDDDVGRSGSTKTVAAPTEPPSEVVGETVSIPPAAPGASPEAAEGEDTTEQVANEEQQAKKQQVKESLFEKGIRLIKELSKYWGLGYATDLASGVYDFAYALGMSSGMSADLHGSVLLNHHYLKEQDTNKP